MKTAIILHGKPSKERYFDPSFPSTSNYYWLPWLQKQFALQGVAANTPEVPEAWKAEYATWKAAFEHYPVNADTTLVGHSCGAGFFVRWLSEHPEVKADKVVLVAPWIDPKREDTTDFFDFTIDANLAARTNGVIIMTSDDDEESVLESVEILKNSIKDAEYREFIGFRHFYDDRRMEFPEILLDLF